ncbi:MAG: glycosyltransferase family 4 protein [Candidatus Zhuqueibacterota bacterium]
MKIAYFNYLYDMEESSVGAAVHVRELGKGLQALGHDVSIHYMNRFTSVASSVQSPIRGYLKRKLWRYLNQVNALVSNAGYFRREWKILSQEKPDVILQRYNFLNVSLVLAARMKKIPLLLEVNAPMAYENKKFSDHAVRLPFFPEYLEKVNLQLADKVYVVSSELKNYYAKRGIAPEKIHVVPNGADEKRFRPDVDTRGILERYSLNNKIVIGFIGSFHYWHGVDNLLKFIKAILSQYNHVCFLLVGTGPLKEDLEKALAAEQKDGKVILPGYIPHEAIPAYLAVMDIVLAPYPRLDFFYYSPLKIFEYMAAGKTVIASRVGQIAEIIRENHDGMLVEPDDFDDMLEKSMKLIRENALRVQMGKNARHTIEQKYTWTRTAETISHLLHEVVK